MEEKEMTRTKNLALACLLGACIATGAAGAALTASVGADALDTTSKVTYPFATGTTAFQYAPSFTAPSAKTENDAFEFYQIKFDAATYDFTDITHVGIQVKMVSGNPGLTVGVINGANNRLCSESDGKPFYILSESGSITQANALYGAINLGADACGTLIMPVSSLQWRAGDNSLTNVNSVYFETNTKFNWNFQLTIGSVVAWKGDPAVAGSEKVTLADCSQAERAASKYYVASGNASCMQFPSELEVPEPAAPAIAYPFRTGEAANHNTATWKGFNVDGSKSNQQTVKVTFDTATADFSNASYLVVQYKNNSAPGLQYMLSAGGANYSVSAKEGERIYFTEEGQTESALACKVLYGHINVSQSGKMGALIIPMSTMAWTGTQADRDLAKIDGLTITTNSQFNGGFELLIGEIGLYEGDAGSGTFRKLLNLSEDKSDHFSVTTALEENKGRLVFYEPPLTQLGDASVDWYAKDAAPEDFSIWNGGANGEVKIVKDSYGDDAVQITATTPNESATADTYVATTLSNGGFSWAGKKGVNFWARNDSDVEINFNIELDCRVKNPATDKTISDRFNVQANQRYYLYDVNTGKTTVYMTRFTCSLPVGFEGWVRIPFSAFARADWSTNGVTQEQFMGEGSTVSYLAITVHQPTYTQKPFAVNKFGAYGETPKFESVIVTGHGKSMKDLLKLDQLTLVHEEEN